MNPALLQLLNASLPSLIGFYKQLRDANPDQPSLTDDQVVELLRSKAEDVKTKADAWLAAHPAAK